MKCPSCGHLEDKVIDYILELATVSEKKVSREDLYKEDEAA